ncbi:MAG TPA: hypothetical protein VKV02_00105 [Acidobacteriaceae bacterium]|nr:hypothetical protein [Acidobacteriaceae bacterium]
MVRAVLDRPSLVSDLIGCAFDAREGVRMRAADALEKVSRIQTEPLRPFVGLLLGLFEETGQNEVRWHLAVLLPRLPLSVEERCRTVAVLERCLEAKSSLVRTFALQGLADLARQEESFAPLVLDRLRTAERTGTPAMKARSRKLLRELERRGGEADLRTGGALREV